MASVLAAVRVGSARAEERAVVTATALALVAIFPCRSRRPTGSPARSPLENLLSRRSRHQNRRKGLRAVTTAVRDGEHASV